MAGKKIVEIPSSKMKLAITKILCEKGYILSYKVVEGQPANTIKIALKYHPQTKTAAIKKIDGVHDATVSFMTQKMTIDAEDDRFDAIMKEVVSVCKKVEPDCVINL